MSYLLSPEDRRKLEEALKHSEFARDYVHLFADQLTAFADRIRQDEREACIAAVETLDCAHRCGVGSEIASAIRSRKP